MSETTSGTSAAGRSAESREAERAARRKRWSPEAGDEAAQALRLLSARPWLVAGRDDAEIALVRRNATAVRDALARLGWALVLERELVRLRKSPPVRRDAGEAPSPQACSWFFVLAAAAESVAPRCGLSTLMTAARAAAAEAGLRVRDDHAERLAVARGYRELLARGVLEQLEGDIDEWVADSATEVLIGVHHTRLTHLIANVGRPEPDADPSGWLAAVEREPDPSRRMRRRLVDDTVVHVADLDNAELDWLSRRLRGDDGGPLAEAFGLHIERRAEGAAFVVPEEAFRHGRELGPYWFPGTGAPRHAALMLAQQARADGQPAPEVGAGWRSLTAEQVLERLTALIPEHGYGKENNDPDAMVRRVRQLLVGLGLLRVSVSEGAPAQPVWLFSPAIGRWQASSVPRTWKRASRAADGGAGSPQITAEMLELAFADPDTRNTGETT